MWAPSIIILARKKFTFMVAYTWCGRWFPMFVRLFILLFNFMWDPLQSPLDSFAHLCLIMNNWLTRNLSHCNFRYFISHFSAGIVFYLTFSIYISCDSYSFWEMLQYTSAWHSESQSPSWIKYKLKFCGLLLWVDFWSMQSQYLPLPPPMVLFVFFFAVLAPHICMYIFFVASARACRIGFRIIFINLGHWQFQFLNNCFCLCLPLVYGQWAACLSKYGHNSVSARWALGRL